MGWAEFLHWLALEQVDPLPDPWLQTGIACASNANLWRGSKGRPAKPGDYIPKARSRPRKQSVASMKTAMAFLRKPRTK